MPETLQKSTVDSNIDPSVAVSWDDKTPKSQQIEDFYKTVDAMKSCMLTTIRDGIGLVSRSMVVGKVHTLLPPLCIIARYAFPFQRREETS